MLIEGLLNPFLWSAYPWQKEDLKVYKSQRSPKNPNGFLGIKLSTWFSYKFGFSTEFFYVVCSSTSKYTNLNAQQRTTQKISSSESRRLSNQKPKR